MGVSGRRLCWGRGLGVGEKGYESVFKGNETVLVTGDCTGAREVGVKAGKCALLCVESKGFFWGSRDCVSCVRDCVGGRESCVRAWKCVWEGRKLCVC